MARPNRVSDPRNCNLTVRVTKTQKERIQEMAEELDSTISDLLLALITIGQQSF